MTQTISQQNKPSFTLNCKEEEESWDDIEFPDSGLFYTNNNEKDYGLSTTTRDMSGITIHDSSDDDSSEVKEMMINRGVVATNDKDEFSGLITRLVGKNNKVLIGDDWDNDMEIPEDGFANLTITSNNNIGGKRSKSRCSSITVTSCNNITNKDYYDFDSWNEEEEDDDKKIVNDNDFITSPRQLVIKRIEDPSKVFSTSKDTKGKSVESFDDDFDFSEVDLNRLNLSAEMLKFYQESDHEVIDKDPFGSEKLSSRNSSRLSILPSPAPTNSSQSAFESGEEEELFDDLQFPEHMDSLTFAFAPDKLKNKNIITRPSTTQSKRTRRESFTIEFAPSQIINNLSESDHLTATQELRTPDITSREELLYCKGSSSESTVSITSTLSKDSRPSTPLPSKTAEASTRRHPSPITFVKNKSPNLTVKGVIPPNNNNTSQVKAKRSIITNTTNSTNNKTTSKKTAIGNTTSTTSIKTKRFQQNTTFNTTSTLVDSILEIMRKPRRQQSFGDGTELDVFDDLPVNLDRECSSNPTNNNTKQDRKNSTSSAGSNHDNLHQGRKKKNRKGKKPQLIRNLNLDKNTKAVGEMVYNPITQRWDGNESVLKEFDNANSPTRPALISNMNYHSTNTKSLQLVGNMKFDPTKMCWNNDYSDDDAIWDSDSGNDSKEKEDIDSDDFCNFNSLQAFSDSNDFQVGSEFDITPGFKAALLASERQHRNEISRWYPGALSKDNDSRFGLRDVTLQRSYLYELRNNKPSSAHRLFKGHKRGNEKYVTCLIQ
ncbi:8219_t:CDS:2 [Funneliformis caledonium]|uniref:8219_t:CDS:1 n=1 Tax=Funneliformis caledonium TaxID=1117310 RepID=A0A9N8VE34_9GLOM|nr:8219_t:CDS:2 [Funneliformis caledonium]